MVFITAIQWGTGISLGLCVGLVAWTFLRPWIAKDKAIFDASLAALIERNLIARDQLSALHEIADGVNSGTQPHLTSMPKTADRVTILLGDTIWLEWDGEITQGFVEAIYSDRADEYTIGWETAGRITSNECGNMDCYSTREAAQAAKDERSSE